MTTTTALQEEQNITGHYMTINNVDVVLNLSMNEFDSISAQAETSSFYISNDGS